MQDTRLQAHLSEGVVRRSLFAVNVAVSIGLVASCVYCLFAPESPFDFLGAIICVMPLCLYSLAEWIAFSQQKWRLERMLGALNLCGAGFVAIGNIANAVDGSSPAPFEFWFWFLLVGVSIEIYLVCCGIFRIRRNPIEHT